MRRIMIVGVAMAAVAVVAVVPAVAQDVEDPWFVDEASLPFEPLPGYEDATQEWGVLNGAGFQIEHPADWNGELVLWAHGFRGDDPELTVDPPPFRAHLLERGFAWAASSYPANGYDVGSGVRSTALLAVSAHRWLPHWPDRHYLAGASMGGHITGVSVERYPTLYDGAMPVCGVLGDYELFDYFLDLNLVAQQLGVGISQFPVDPEAYVELTVPAIKDALTVSEGGWPLDLNERGEQYRTMVELRSGGERPNFDEAFDFWFGLPTATGVGNFFFDLGLGDGTLPNSGGRSVIENTDVTYQLDLDPAVNDAEASLNAFVERVALPPAGRPPGEAITGDIEIPVLTLHNLGDLFVPFGMEIDYARDVAARGNSELLVQRAIRGVGHCGFTDAELTQGFDDLVTWVRDGVRPAGDEVLDPAAVAAEDYGCAFTDPAPDAHLFAAPCP